MSSTTTSSKIISMRRRETERREHETCTRRQAAREPPAQEHEQVPIDVPQEQNMAHNPPAVAGARNPGKQTQNNILDYSIEKDIKFYNKATEKLEDA